MTSRIRFLFFTSVASFAFSPALRAADITLTNATWTPTAGLYSEVNDAFAARYKAATGDAVTVVRSSGGCTAQACAVRDGSLHADVVSLATAADVDALHAPAGLLAADWRDRFPNRSSPFGSPVVFLVRAGNPKALNDWPDLAKDGVSLLAVDPKLSHSARWFYLAARGAATRAAGGDDAKGLAFVTRLYSRAEIGARVGASIDKFAKGGSGDAIVVSESEALGAVAKYGKDKVAVVRPSSTLLEELPVAVVSRTAEAHGAGAAAEAYVKFLYSPEGAEIIARNHYRPADAAVLARHAAELPPVATFTIDATFGGWAAADSRFFSDGGEYDRIVSSR